MSTQLITKTEILSQALSHLTYNGDELKIPHDQKLNVYMGIGLWSVKQGLSSGLPVDVMQMLLSAAVLRSQIMEANSSTQSKVIILIADSMAIDEGAKKENVERLVTLYKSSLDPLLKLVKLKECSEIVLSSELAALQEYQAIQKSIEDKEKMQALTADKVHYAYIRTQSAITHYMHEKREVGVKVGWLCTKSNQDRLSKRMSNAWDERRFDCIYDTMCPDSSMQYLYSKAGLKQQQDKKSITVSESCPYTAYGNDRYTIQLGSRIPLKNICPLQRSTAAHWRGTAEICSQLIEVEVLSENILPKDCIRPTNQISTVYNTLDHWVNYLSVLNF